MEVNNLLEILNQKSVLEHIGYVLQYNYQYSFNLRKVYAKTFLLKYKDSKLVEKIRLSGVAQTVNCLTQELSLYH